MAIVISFFYNQSGWHKLLSDLIQPCLAAGQSVIQSWYIYFRTDRGEHITLAVHLNDAGDEAHFKTNLIQDSNHFFSKHALETEKKVYPLEGFFMDYPNNSVVFGIEKAPSVIHESQSGQIRRHLTATMVNVLAGQEIDMEFLYTFIIYLHIGIIKAAAKDIKKARQQTTKLESKFKGLLLKKGNSFINNYKDDLFQLLEQNETALNEIIEDTWNKTLYDEEMQWLALWERACAIYLEGENFQDAYYFITNAIYEHIGLKDEKRNLQTSKYILNFFNRITKNLAINRIV